LFKIGQKKISGSLHEHLSAFMSLAAARNISQLDGSAKWQHCYVSVGKNKTANCVLL